MDTNIDNYNRKELLQILELDEFIDDDTILTSLNKIIASYRGKNDQSLVQFFEDAKEKLLNEKKWDFGISMFNPFGFPEGIQEGFNGEDPQQGGNESEESEENEEDDFGEKSPGEKTPQDLSDKGQVQDWMENQYFQQPNPAQARKITSRQNQIQILDDDAHPIMQQNRLGIGNSFSSKVGQGNINPNLRQINTKLITIDSQYRDNIIPYSEDVNSITCSTNFTCSLTQDLKRVLSLRLKSMFIPKAWYLIDTNLCNTSFMIEEVPPGSATTTITIQSGNYDISGLITEINEQLNTTPDPVFHDISIGISNTNVSNPVLQFENSSGTGSEFNIFFMDSSCNGISQPIYQQSLGYILGYRMVAGDTEFSINLPITTPPDGVVAQTHAHLTGTQYFRLIIDDFNNNYLTSGGVGIEKAQTKLPLPSYSGKIITDSSNCSFNDCSGNVQFVPSFPPKLTQAQIYSLNQIYCNRKATTDSSAPIIPNTFAIIQLPNKTNETDDFITITGFSNTAIRTYFGPINLERLKVTLMDERGNILNLHGHDWSFTLAADLLYQY